MRGWADSRDRHRAPEPARAARVIARAGLRPRGRPPRGAAGIRDDSRPAAAGSAPSARVGAGQCRAGAAPPGKGSRRLRLDRRRAEGSPTSAIGGRWTSGWPRSTLDAQDCPVCRRRHAVLVTLPPLPPLPLSPATGLLSEVAARVSALPRWVRPAAVGALLMGTVALIRATATLFLRGAAPSPRLLLVVLGSIGLGAYGGPGGWDCLCSGARAQPPLGTAGRLRDGPGVCVRLGARLRHPRGTLGWRRTCSGRREHGRCWERWARCSGW